MNSEPRRDEDPQDMRLPKGEWLPVRPLSIWEVYLAQSDLMHDLRSWPEIRPIAVVSAYATYLYVTVVLVTTPLYSAHLLGAILILAGFILLTRVLFSRKKTGV